MCYEHSKTNQETEKAENIIPYKSSDLTRVSKIAIQGTHQMTVDKEAIIVSRVYSYEFECRPTCPYAMRNPP